MTADPQKSQANLDNPVEIIIRRTFTAPRELVWKAWTSAEHVGNWWGPAGFTTTTHSMDFRPGGSWHYTMYGPDGHDYVNRVNYLEIEEPSRLVYTLGGEVLDNDVSFRTEVMFEPAGEDGRETQVTMRSIFPTAEKFEDLFFSELDVFLEGRLPPDHRVVTCTQAVSPRLARNSVLCIRRSFSCRRSSQALQRRSAVRCAAFAKALSTSAT